jgi:glycosyltransferase involved in cell wall biosynthesis
MIRVTYMIDHLFEVEGGGEQALLRILRHLPRRRFRPSVVTFIIKPRTREILRQLECPLYVFPVRRTYGWTGLNAAWRIRNLFRTEKPDIVHTFFETSNTWGGLVTKLSFGPVLVSSRRDMGILQAPKHRMAYKLVNMLSDRVQAVSGEVRRACIEREGITPRKVCTVYNGIDLAGIDHTEAGGSLRAGPGLNRPSHIVTTVANIRRVKGLDTFVRAADIVRRRFESVLFLVVGAPNEQPHFQELQLLVRDLGLERNVAFLGKVDDVVPLLKQSDVFCLLSRSEGFSNALLEAMACGLPCVVTRVGGSPEAIREGENGYLVPTDDAITVASRVITLLETPEKADHFGRLARKTVEDNFTINHMLDQLTTLYNDVLRRPTISGSLM